MKLHIAVPLLVLVLGACSDGPIPGETATEASSDQRAESQPSSSPVGPNATTPQSLSGEKPSNTPNPHARLSPEQHIAVALQHAQQGRYTQAVDILDRAIQETPEHAGLFGARGSLKLGMDKATEALVDLERAVSIAPESALLRVNRSQAYRKFNRLDEALDDLEKAVALSPKLIPARFNRGVLYYGNTEYEKALADFDLCIELDETTPGPYFNRAITRDAMGDTEGAVSDLNRFISLADNAEWKQAARDTLGVIEKRESMKAR
jgi:tetratricopeptide (TPR) repeat protein